MTGYAKEMIDYWNHNTAYHPELLDAVPSHTSHVLDVGCGDGLLLQKLSTRTEHLTGIDPDSSALSQARTRFSNSAKVRLILGHFLISPELEKQGFDLNTCVPHSIICHSSLLSSVCVTCSPQEDRSESSDSQRTRPSPIGVSPGCFWFRSG